MVRAQPCERCHPHGRKRQHGVQAAPCARDGERVGGRAQPGTDEVAFYSFDTSLHEIRPFSTTFTATEGAWHATKAYGATSLWDAIAETAQKISDRQRRRALVVITDGVDSASTLKPSDVSAIASSLDVPVYILVVAFTGDEDGAYPQCAARWRISLRGQAEIH